MLKEQKLLKTISMTTAGGIDTVEIPRIFVSRKWQLRLKAVVTAIAIPSGCTYGTHVANSPATLIQRFDLKVTSDRSQLLKSLTGEDLYYTSLFENGGAQENVNNTPESTTTAAGSYTSYGSYDVFFGLPDGAEIAYQTVNAKGIKQMPTPYHPNDLTLFNPTLFNPVEVSITWGTIANVNTGYTAGALTLASAEIKIVTEDIPEISGVFSLNRELYKEAVISALSTDMRIDLPKGNMIRKIYIQAYDNGVRDNSIVNNVKVVVNENLTKVDAGFNQLRNENAKRYKVPYASLPTGVCVIDFDERKDLKGLLDVTNVDNVRLSLDVNSPTLGTDKIHIIVQEITP